MSYDWCHTICHTSYVIRLVSYIGARYGSSLMLVKMIEGRSMIVRRTLWELYTQGCRQVYFVELLQHSLFQKYVRSSVLAMVLRLPNYRDKKNDLPKSLWTERICFRKIHSRLIYLSSQKYLSVYCATVHLGQRSLVFKLSQ